MGPDLNLFTDLPDLSDGACVNTATPDDWFPEDIRDIGRRYIAASFAIAACDRCPLATRNRCLEFGLEPRHLEYGIYGGLMAGERIAFQYPWRRWTKEQRVKVMEARRLRKLMEEAQEGAA